MPAADWRRPPSSHWQVESPTRVHGKALTAHTLREMSLVGGLALLPSNMHQTTQGAVQQSRM